LPGQVEFIAPLEEVEPLELDEELDELELLELVLLRRYITVKSIIGDQQVFSHR
jgi:hypothetical protein